MTTVPMARSSAWLSSFVSAIDQPIVCIDAKEDAIACQWLAVYTLADIPGSKVVIAEWSLNKKQTDVRWWKCDSWCVSNV